MQLCVVFEKETEKEKKNLALSPCILLTLQIMLIKRSTYKYVINCINIFTHTYKLIRLQM